MIHFSDPEHTAAGLKYYANDRYNNYHAALSVLVQRHLRQRDTGKNNIYIVLSLIYFIYIKDLYNFRFIYVYIYMSLKIKAIKKYYEDEQKL